MNSCTSTLLSACAPPLRCSSGERARSRVDSADPAVERHSLEARARERRQGDARIAWRPAISCWACRPARSSAGPVPPGLWRPSREAWRDLAAHVLHGGADTLAPYRALSPSRSSWARARRSRRRRGPPRGPCCRRRPSPRTRASGCRGCRGSRARGRRRSRHDTGSWIRSAPVARAGGASRRPARALAIRPSTE